MTTRAFGIVLALIFIVANAANGLPGSSNRSDASFHLNAGSDEVHRYVVRFEDAPLASYRGNIDGFQATSPGAPGTARSVPGDEGVARRKTKLDTSNSASVAYLAYLDSQHNEFENTLQRVVPDVEVVYRYRYSFNGMALRMTRQQAVRVSRMAGVKAVQRDFMRELQTANSVSWIGAPQVWDGSATGGLEARGEGVIIGFVDTGINTAHPSFAEVSPGDGYVHINPLGDNVFLNDCAPFDPVTNPNGGQPELCNNKLIGTMVLPFAADSSEQNNAEDIVGHGSHMAGVAAGNLLLDVPLVGAGVPTGVVFDQISGVAPRANLVAYMVCGPNGCALSDLIIAIDSAIVDGVDVISYALGSGPDDPWNDFDSLALLGARDAGIFVTTAIGRSGPTPGTIGSPAVSPWVTSVGASTHPRTLGDMMLTDFAGGDTAPPDPIAGRGASAGFGPAPIVYAGDFGDPLCPMGAFPPNSFDGAIVVCDRGEFALVDKAESVANGGAGAVVIANTEGSGQTLFDLPYLIPGMLIALDNGDALRQWLSTGSDHVARIGGTTPFIDESLADTIATFSSRGPNSVVPDIISPTMAAPGVDIYAAYNAPIQYDSLDGTSPAAAHVAGAAALLRQLYPGWTVAEIHSALASTGQRFMTREEDEQPATPFEFGGGRVQVAEAANAGLVLHETYDNFQAANPASGGDASALNLPSFSQSECLDNCSWTRTLRATTSATWAADAESGAQFGIEVSPQTFTLTEGDLVTLTVAADTQGLPLDEWVFGWVHLTPDDEMVSVQSLPLAVKASEPFVDTDSDTDGVFDSADNCTLVANADQLDTDGDGYGNLCDGDFNNDCIVDYGDVQILESVFFAPADIADIDGDGWVNFQDLSLFRPMLSQAPGPGAEPVFCSH